MAFWLLEQSPKTLLAFVRGGRTQVISSKIHDHNLGVDLVYIPIFVASHERISNCPAVQGLGADVVLVELPT
jgi:hypothetical protein